MDLSALEMLTTGLQQVDGVNAVVVGGSRCRGLERADSDWDLAIYYDQVSMLDVKAVVERFHDGSSQLTVTESGEWGPWIDGGSFFRVDGVKFDLLYRNLGKVGAVISESQAGVFSSHYQPGHPAGYHSYHLMAEIALCRVVHDPDSVIAELKSRTTPYPPALRSEIIRRFLWEADFQLEIAEKMQPGEDPFYEQLSVMRLIGCVVQVLYAINEQWFLNEKRAVAEAAGLATTVEQLSDRVAQLVLPGTSTLPAARDVLSEVEKLATAHQ